MFMYIHVIQFHTHFRGGGEVRNPFKGQSTIWNYFLTPYSKPKIAQNSPLQEGQTNLHSGYEIHFILNMQYYADFLTVSNHVLWKSLGKLFISQFEQVNQKLIEWSCFSVSELSKLFQRYCPHNTKKTLEYTNWSLNKH